MKRSRSSVVKRSLHACVKSQKLLWPPTHFPLKHPQEPTQRLRRKSIRAKTLATWRNQLINERSFEALQDALEAIPTLTSASERQAIINEFLMNYPTTLSVNNQVDLLKQILRIEGDSHKYVEAIVTALPNVDDEKPSYSVAGACSSFRIRHTNWNPQSKNHWLYGQQNFWLLRRNEQAYSRPSGANCRWQRAFASSDI